MYKSIMDFFLEPIQTQDPSLEDEVKFYHWNQCKEMVTVVFDLSIENENEIECTIAHNHISIKLKSEKVFLDGNLEKDILEDASKLSLIHI